MAGLSCSGWGAGKGFVYANFTMDVEQSNSADGGFEKRYFQVARREIGYLRFICESYDGLVFLRTIDSAAGLIEVAWPRQRHVDVRELLAALASETGLQAVARPSRLPPL